MKRIFLKTCGLALAICVLAAGVGAAETNAVRRVSVDEFEKLWQTKTNVVLDVRTEKEFTAGHIPGATNLDINSPGFEEKLAKLDKSKTYLVHCAAGSRSARASEKMKQMGFQSVADLPAGFRGWEKAGKPVEK
jgi:rhodanese-related sulfurtransferase